MLPIHNFRSQSGKGKEGLMQAELLALAPPAATTAGQAAADSNEALWARLEPYFGDDTWGMARFLFDLATRLSLRAVGAAPRSRPAGRVEVPAPGGHPR